MHPINRYSWSGLKWAYRGVHIITYPWPFIGVKWLFSRGPSGKKEYCHELELELFQLALIRPWIWGTVFLWTPPGSKNKSRQSWTIEEIVRFSTKTDFFSIVQLWRLVYLEPGGVQRHTVPHFKGLINANWKYSSSRSWQYSFLALGPLEKSHFTPIKGKGYVIIWTPCKSFIF